MGIQILPPQLANQIAAGEVVERPASVVKELVENSLDAGATRIDIEIEKGGGKLLKIRDNGAGIPREELALALSRHATSKLHSLDDLDAILSFGFRGEALASISSVARLTLTSRTAEQKEAWQAYTEGLEMAVNVVPAAHPVGTTIEVVDLFFNTPARRRFLKSDKTEFTHIDEWLKRMALVRGEIHFTLMHNGKLVRNYRPATNEAQYMRRLAQVSGRVFAEQALKVECQHGDIKLSGYLQSPLTSAVVNDTHYFYVNGRLIRDRLVNHAVRQAFAQQTEVEQPGYVLMLDIEPHQVDVNVHPAKHEVRFHQGRYVHDYILQALQSALESVSVPTGLTVEASRAPPQHIAAVAEVNPPLSKNVATLAHVEQGKQVVSPESDRPDSTDAEYKQQRSADASQGAKVQTNAYGSMQTPKASYASASSPNSRSRSELPSSAAIASYSALLQTPDYKVQESDSVTTIAMPAILAGKYWVMVSEDALNLLPIERVALATREHEIRAKLATGLIGQPLLMPVSVQACPDWQAIIDEHEALLRQLGLELTIRYEQLIIKKVPQYLRDCQLASVIPKWLQSLRFDTPDIGAIASWIATESMTEFTPASQVWAAFSVLTKTQRDNIVNNATSLPWQVWLKEQNQ